MMTLRSAFVLFAVAAACQETPAELPPDVWVSDGDSDGDGLKDDFEARHGLDPQQAISHPDGIPDEDRLGADGKTLWEAQSSEQRRSPPGGGSGGCGLLGLEALAVLAVLRRARRGTYLPLPK